MLGLKAHDSAVPRHHARHAYVGFTWLHAARTDGAHLNSSRQRHECSAAECDSGCELDADSRRGQLRRRGSGSLWVLATAPAGPDKYMWHYVSGTWTNISGLATRLSVAPNGTLYAINSGGGTYSYSGGSWTALGGGASDITVAADGSFYVLSNGNAAGSDQAIWHYTNSWTQVPGSGVRIAASWDPNSFVLASGTVSPGGLCILNSIGSIYYENTNNSFAQLPGSASAIAPTTIGGVFVLGYPANSSGNNIYYCDLNTPGWNALSGAGVSISTDSGSSTLYVVASSGAIYSSPITPVIALSPSSVAFTVTGSANAQNVTPSETGYSGSFDLSSLNCSNVATFPASTSGTFAVTPVAAGTCNITVSDALGQSANLAVTVTTPTPNSRVQLLITNEITPGNIHWTDIIFKNLTSYDIFVDFIGNGCQNAGDFCKSTNGANGWWGETSLYGMGDNSVIYIEGDPDNQLYPTIPQICYNARIQYVEPVTVFTSPGSAYCSST